MWFQVALLAAGRLAGRGALVLVLAYCTGVAVLALLQRHFIFPGAYLGASGPLFDDADLPASVVRTTVLTDDGPMLRALWKEPRPGCGVIVSFHGNGSFPEQVVGRFDRGPWARDGWGFLAIAYRGYPGSTGSPSEDGLIQDGLAAFAEARRRAPASPVLLHGHSLGAAVAVAVAEREPDHVGLYLEAPFASLAALAQSRYPFVPVSLFLKDPMRSDRRIGNVGGPIVIVHGTADGVVPVAEGRRLAAAAPKGAVLDVIAGDHMSVLGARDGFYEPLFQREAGGCPTP